APAAGRGLVGPVRGPAAPGTLRRVLRLRIVGRLPAPLRPLHRPGRAPAADALRLPPRRGAAHHLAFHREASASEVGKSHRGGAESAEDAEKTMLVFRANGCRGTTRHT